MKPQSTNHYNGKYTLYVSPFHLDVTSSIAGIVLGLLDPFAGVGYTVGFEATMRFLGYRGIGYNIGDLFDDTSGIAASLMEGISNNKFFKSAGQGIGTALDILEVGSYLKDWFMDHNYQIEEAIFNHFNSDVWISSTRDAVDKKFEDAMRYMTSLMFSGKIELKKAVDVFGKNAFTNYGSLGTKAWRYDPLTGKERYFHQDRYYFFMIDDSMEGIISDIESDFNTKRKYRH